MIAYSNLSAGLSYLNGVIAKQSPTVSGGLRI